MNACQSIFHQYIDSSGMITSNPTWTIDIMRSLLRPLLISPFSASLPLLTTIFSAYNSFIIWDYLMSIQATLISIPKTILAALGVIVQHLLFILLLLIDNYYCIYRQSSLLLVATQKVYQFISLSLQSPFTFSNKSSGLASSWIIISPCPPWPSGERANHPSSFPRTTHCWLSLSL